MSPQQNNKSKIEYLFEAVNIARKKINDEKKKLKCQNYYHPITNVLMARLIKLEPYHTAYRFLTSYFYSRCNKLAFNKFKIISISKIDNPLVKKSYNHTYYRNNALNISSKRYVGFRCVHLNELNSIIQYGFDQRLSKGAFGKAIEFGLNPIKADMDYTFQGKYRLMVLTDIMPGHSYLFEPNVIHPNLVKEPFGYDSVLGTIFSKKYGEKFSTLNIYNNFQTWPRYIIEYTTI